MAATARVKVTEKEADMTHKFTNKEFRMLAEAERQMDAGEIPFVVCNRQRFLVQPVIMEELGLEPGQTVSDTLVLAIMEATVASLEADVALERAK